MTERRASCVIHPAISGSFPLTANYVGDADNDASQFTRNDAVRVQGEADLAVLVDNGLASITRMTPIDYLVSVHNIGPGTALAASLQLSASEAPTAQALRCIELSSDVRCNVTGATTALLDLPPGGEALLRWTITLPSGDAAVSVQAELLPGSAGSDPESGNNVATDGPDATSVFAGALLQDGFESR